jgi:ATP-dependent RNA helicase SUPV3L1/SUV3
MVGYRVCGNRAIRVDILERLADLIRPALSWRPAMPGEKPPGTFDGRGFTVTVGMTSLAGCSGEDFASILRSLGYRLDRRPPLPPAPPATPDTSVAPEAADGAPEVAAAAPEATETPVEATAEPASDETAAAEIPPVEATLSEVAIEAPAEIDLSNVEAVAEAAAASETTAAATPAEPEMIDVWRPGRPEGARRPPRKPKQPRRQVNIPNLAAAPAQQAADGAAPAQDAQAQTAAKPERKPREQRDGHNRKGRSNNIDGRRPDRPRQQQARPERARDNPIDTNSPFAALLDLKARLEAEQKEKG